jgi:hypothetical protein
MTFPAHPVTLCPRCGGHATRCECAELRREGMLMAAARCEEIGRWYMRKAAADPSSRQGLAYSGAHRCADRIRALARKPPL